MALPDPRMQGDAHPTPTLSFDNDKSSRFSMDSGGIRESQSVDDADTDTDNNHVMQSLQTQSFSAAGYRGGEPTGELLDQDAFAVYRDVAVLDYANRDMLGPRIRILQIKPGIDGSEIYCNLVKRHLWDAGEYKALSYSWGSNQDTRDIFIESRNTASSRFRVSDHLWHALNRLRDENRVTNVWIDAICIDQINHIERAEQVNIMTQIYNQASEVRVWLGEVFSFGAKADRAMFLTLCRQPNPWWTRLWIVQECAYAENCPVVMLGAHLMTFEHLIKRWRAAKGSAAKKAVLLDNWKPWDDRDMQINLRLLETPFNIWAAQKTNSRHRLPLMRRLQEMAGRKCTDPHDRIYALLGLIEEHEAALLTPDYRKPFLDLILEVAGVLRKSPDWDERRDSHVFNLLGPAHLVRIAFLNSESAGQCEAELLRALSDGEWEVVEFLIPKCKYLAGSPHRDEMLHQASVQGYRNAVQMLIKSGANVNKLGKDGRTALQAAWLHGHTEVVKMLIRAGADVKGDEGGPIALIEASQTDRDKVVKTLIHAGVDVNAREGNECALYLATCRGHLKIMEMLLAAGANVDKPMGVFSGNALYGASRAGNIEAVKMLMHAGADATLQGGSERTALKAASVEGHQQVVKLLIQAGADVNNQGGCCFTALHAASAGGHIEVAKMLLDAGAEVNLRGGHNPRGGCYGTPLYEASARGHVEIVKMLIDAGADINLEGGRYRTALEAARRRGHDGLMNMLIDSGAGSAT